MKLKDVTKVTSISDNDCIVLNDINGNTVQIRKIDLQNAIFKDYPYSLELTDPAVLDSYMTDGRVMYSFAKNAPEHVPLLGVLRVTTYTYMGQKWLIQEAIGRRTSSGQLAVRDYSASAGWNEWKKLV